MAYESLKQEIRQYIKTNGQNEITGQILQNVLIDMVNQYPSLDGYATQQWVESQNYISEADLANYATQAWVSQNFLALSGGTMTGDLTFRSGNGISVYYQYGDPSDPEYDVILIKDGVVSVGNGGDITIGGNSVWHTGNLNPSDYMPSTTAIINSIVGDELGHLTLTGPNFPATVIDFSHQHRWEELIDVPTNLRDLGITEEYLPLSGGTMTGSIRFTADQGIVLDTDNSILVDSTDSSLCISAYDSVKFFIDSAQKVSIDSTAITAPSFVKSGGTSLQFLKADGSVDSNTYATQSWVSQNFLALSGGTMTGDLTFRSGNGISVYYQYGDPSDPEYDVILIKDGVVSVGNGGDITIGGNSVWHAGNLNPLDYMPRSTAVINSVTGDELGHLTLTGPNFPATVLDFSHQHRWEELIDVPTNLRDLGITEEYLPLSGGTMTGSIRFTADQGIVLDTDNSILVDSTDSSLCISAYDSVKFFIDSAQKVSIDSTSITAPSFVKSGGTSLQFLKADGSVDSNTYATQSWVSQNFLALSGGTMTGDLTFRSGNGISVYYQYGDPSDPEYDVILIKDGVVSVGNGGDITIGGNSVWHTGNLNPSDYMPSTTAVINSVTGDELGHLTLTGLNFPATVLDFSHQHRWEELIDVPTNLRDLGITEEYLPLSGGTMTGSIRFTADQGIVLDTDNSILVDSTDSSLCISAYDSVKFFIDSAQKVSIDSTAITAPSFVKSGGTSLQFLKADGSVDSNTYATQSWVGQQGYITSSALSGYATQSWVSQNFLALSGGTMTGDLTFRSGNGISVYYQYGDPSDPEYDVILIKDGVVSVGNGGDITIGGNSVWHAGNLNPSDYMLSTTAIINSVVCDELGHLTLTGLNFPATVLDFSHQHRWEELIDVPTNLRDLGITEEYLPLSGGTMTGSIRFTADQGIVLDTDNSILVDSTDSSLCISAYDSVKFFIDSAQKVSIDSTSITAPSFVKSGGTSLQFLKADGSVDSNTYATQSWVGQQGYITSSALSGYATQSWVSQNFLALSGGTMTGDLTFRSGNGISVYYQYGDPSDPEYDVILIKDGIVSVGNGGDITIGGNSVWHAGNLNPSDYMLSTTAVINSVVGDELGHLTLTGPNFPATVIDFSHQHRWEELIDVPTNLRDLGITEEYLSLSGGTMTGSIRFTADQGIVLDTDNSILVDSTDSSLCITAYDSVKFFIDSAQKVSIDSTAITAPSFVKSGGTSLQFLKADGSVDSNTYATQSWVGQQGYITSSALSGYATQSWVSSNYATQSTVNGLSYINGVALNGDGGLTLTGPNFSATVIDFSHQHRWEELIDVPTNLRDLGITEEYLPLTGGTLTGTLTMSNAIIISGNNSIFFDIDNNICADTYGSNSSRLYITGYDGIRLLINNPNQVTHTYLDITDSGVNINGDAVATQSWVQQQGYITSAPVTSVAGYTGAVTVADLATALGLSDIRKKNVIDYDVDPGFETVANAPTIRFTWKDRGMLDNRGECVGSIAQYWQMALPEAVMTDSEGYLSMQYDVIALIAAVSVAKRVASHEQRIKELERENALLKMDIKALKGEA